MFRFTTGPGRSARRTAVAWAGAVCERAGPAAAKAAARTHRTGTRLMAPPGNRADCSRGGSAYARPGVEAAMNAACLLALALTLPRSAQAPPPDEPRFEDRVDV